MKENRRLLKEVLKDIRHDMTDEEVLNLLADSKISESPTAEKYTLGQRAADAIAKFAGSWGDRLAGSDKDIHKRRKAKAKNEPDPGGCGQDQFP